jgi:hypothetical protein
MKLSEFKIGETFFCGGNTWRCTDVGSRIVSAIQVDGTDGIKIVSFENGEYDQEGCSLKLHAAK